MDNFVTIIIVLLIAAASIFQKVRSKQKPKNDPQQRKPAGWAAKINDFFTAIQERIEAEANKGPSKAAPWQELMDDGTSSIGSSIGDQEPIDDRILDEVVPAGGPSTQTIGKRTRPSKRPSVAPPVPGMPTLSDEPVVQALPRTRSDLRKAVIWAEIIGPPLALKDRQDHHF